MGSERHIVTVQGTVTDSTGAVVPDSDVTLINNETGVKLLSKSDNAGNYSFPTVTPGLYTLEVAKDGIRRITRSRHSASSSASTRRRMRS